MGLRVEGQSLEGKVAIITGASSGIGAAVARSLVAHGASVAVTARRADRIATLQEELGAARALAIAGDVAAQADVERLVARTLDRFGRLDILLANAGQFKQGHIAGVDVETLVGIVNTNVIGVLRCIKAVLPHMLAQHAGDIIVTSSISGHTEIDNEAVYSASKHAVQTLVHLLRKEVAPHGVRVASIAPGIVLNEIWGITDPAAIATGLRERSGLCSEDVAELIVQMLRMPARITLRDLVALAQGQII